MSNQKEAPRSLTFAVGNKFDGVVITESKIIDDILLIRGKNAELNAYDFARSTPSAPIPYTLDELPVTTVYLPKRQKYFILGTKKGLYLRDEYNEAIEDFSNWQDAYYEPFSEQFFRKNADGYWVDMENHFLAAPIFLSGNVLISLNTKKSIQSYGFLNQNLMVSQHQKLIQLGKVVYNADLEIQYFFNKKIAGLKNKTIALGTEGAVVEILLGLEKSAFIWEEDGRPFLCNEKPILQYIGNFQGKDNRFEIFHDGDQEVVWNVNGNTFICQKEIPIQIDFDSSINIENAEYFLGTVSEKSFYINIQTGKKFKVDIKDRTEVIIAIDSKPIKLNKQTYWNVRSDKSRFVYCGEEQSILKFSNGQEPEALHDIPGLKRLFGCYEFEETKRIFRKSDLQVIQLGKEAIEISSLQYAPNQKLYNAKDTQQQEFVLDVRQGMDLLAIAYSGSQKVVSILGEPQTIGRAIWQNAKIETLGGSSDMVININHLELPPCQLPADLLAIPDSTEPSFFHSSKIIQIDFDKNISIGEDQYFSATILSYDDRPFKVLINQTTGRPLQLEGSGHKNELVTQVLSSDEVYHFGPHSLIRVGTLTEDYVESSLLCSIETKSSTLLFNESFLPPLKRVAQIEEETNWPYQLFEVHGVSVEKEFFAVEKVAPYRILVEKKGKIEAPKMIKSSAQALKEPEKVSALRKIFFKDPGYLRVVE